MFIVWGTLVVYVHCLRNTCSICSSQYKQNLHQKFMYLYMICFVLFLWYFPPLVFIYIYMLAWAHVSILSLFLCFSNWTLKSFRVCGIFCFSLSFIIVYWISLKIGNIDNILSHTQGVRGVHYKPLLQTKKDHKSYDFCWIMRIKVWSLVPVCKTVSNGEFIELLEKSWLLV